MGFSDQDSFFVEPRSCCPTLHETARKHFYEVLADRPVSVKSTSPVTENHYKNGYVNNKNFIMTNVDINSDTKYTINNDTNNHDTRDLHK